MSTKEEDEEEEEAVETDRRSEQTNVARGTDGGSWMKQLPEESVSIFTPQLSRWHQRPPRGGATDASSNTENDAGFFKPENLKIKANERKKIFIKRKNKYSY